ncbi:hypothetical protein [Legionella gratiana]|uniref:hypothetical protein n=1 Tax=Legionella gratiana TaxID=45066 RepID=UPI0007301B2F|nr:hypothetical protein [Legionella gratiana]
MDLERRHALVHPDESKTKKAIPVPLNAQAMEILEKQKAIILLMFLLTWVEPFVSAVHVPDITL